MEGLEAGHRHESVEGGIIVTRPLEFTDERARKIARTDFSRSIALEAAAGTGKTEALANRVLGAVAHGHARKTCGSRFDFTRMRHHPGLSCPFAGVSTPGPALC